MMRMNPAMGLLAALAILPATGLAADPAHVGRHYGYGHGPGWGVHYGQCPAYVGHHYGGPPRAAWAHRHGWGQYAPGYFSSSAVAVGSFVCRRDPAYRMDPRC